MKFVLHWKHGASQTVEGEDIALACNSAGIGRGALSALDFYHEEGDVRIIFGKPLCNCTPPTTNEH